MKTFEGKLVSKSIKVGIVAARFNEFITSKLLNGALDGLLRHPGDGDVLRESWKRYQPGYDRTEEVQHENDWSL